jgi:hypothetical protein
MKKTILVLALVLAQVPAFAAIVSPVGGDQEYPVVQCSSAVVRDAGLQVTIMNGGLLPHLSAQVSETSIVGSQVILQVPMLSATQQGPNAIYVDSANRGQDFTLAVNTTVRTPNTPNATLSANTQAGRIQVALVCYPVGRVR